jgi:hypothetical protein
VPINFRDNKYEIVDNLTKIFGSHTLKLGVDVRRYDTSTTNAGWSRGNFNFNPRYTGNAFGDFLLALPESGTRSFPRNAFGIHYVTNQQFYVQDDWKVAKNVTLNLGMRYELNHQPSVLHNQLASTDPVTKTITVASDSSGNINLGGQQVAQYLYPLYANIIVPSSKAGLDNTLKHLDKNNFAPRIGIAWRPLGSDLVIRTGYGIFYGLIQGNRLESTGIVNPPFLADESVSNSGTDPKSLAKLFADGRAWTSRPTLSFFQLDPNARDPYIQQWNFAIQKVVGGVLSLEGAYVGNKGTKLEFSRPVNVPAPGSGNIQARRMWTDFSAGWLVENSAYSNYNAFQGKAEIKTWHGLSFLGSYTWGKAIDNLSADRQDFSDVDPDNHRNNKGLADFDVRHRLVWSGNYLLPLARGMKGLGYVIRDWEVGSIVTAQSGSPFSTGTGKDTANTGMNQRRPDRIGDGRIENRTLDRDFDVQAFAVPTDFRYGNSGRNILHRRGFVNWDFMLVRKFRITERSTLHFRGEFFNFTNTPAFGGPDGNILSSNAGRILSAGEPRDVQLALKFVF